jgi:DNA-binding transcriptional ArsR family regulator
MTTDTLSRAFAALADPTRRDMVARLCEGEATVSRLAEPYRMTLQAVYKHLRVLEDAGLVSRPRGPQPRPVRLEVEALDLMDTWIERHRRRVEERHRRLDAVLARMKGDEDGQDHRDDDRGRPEAAGHPDGSRLRGDA